MPQLRTRMPCDIDQYIEPFAGGEVPFEFKGKYLYPE